MTTDKKMFDPLKLARRLDQPTEDGRVAFEVDADALYPAALEAIRTGCDPTPAKKPEHEADVRHYRTKLANVRKDSQALQDADIGPPAFEIEPISDETRARRGLRALVLETAREWFTNELHRAIDLAPMSLHICVNRQPCTNCEGKGRVTAGQVEIDCPVCHGAKTVKLPSKWRL